MTHPINEKEVKELKQLIKKIATEITNSIPDHYDCIDAMTTSLFIAGTVFSALFVSNFQKTTPNADFQKLKKICLDKISQDIEEMFEHSKNREKNND